MYKKKLNKFINYQLLLINLSNEDIKQCIYKKYFLFCFLFFLQSIMIQYCFVIEISEILKLKYTQICELHWN